MQDLLPADLQLSLPVFAGYENALNLDICASLQKRCSIAEACQSSNTIVDAAYGGEPSAAQNFRSANCVWLPRAFFQTRVLEEIAKTGNSLTAHDNLFLPGMTIRSRENVKSQDIHTNQTAIFLAFRVREPWRFQSLRRSEYVLTAAKVFKGASAKAPRRTAATESATQFELDSPAAFEMTPENMVAEAARLVEMLVLDVSSRSLKVVRPCIKFLCEGCEKGEACCSAHLAEASRVCYLCFNWTVYYTNTIFNLQGSTISDDRLFLLPQHVFRSNKLRTLYILLSRCARPQQIVTDVSFVRHVLAIVFNTNVPKIDEFLSANELSIKPNFSLDQLTRASA